MVVRSILFVSVAGAMAAACGGHKSDTLFLDYAVDGNVAASPQRTPPSAPETEIAQTAKAQTGPPDERPIDAAPPGATPPDALPAGRSSSDDGKGGRGGAPGACRDWRFDGGACAMVIEDDDLLDPMDEGFADRDELDDDIADDILDDLDPDIDDELNDD